MGYELDALKRYVQFLESVRKWVSIYASWLEEIRTGKSTEKLAEGPMKHERKELAKLISDYNKEESYIKLCPVCNRIANGEVCYPFRVGASMEFSSDVFQRTSGYGCTLCGYQNYSKIEHWE